MMLRNARTLVKNAYLSARAVALQFAVSTPAVPSVDAGPASILIVSQRRLGDVSLEIPVIRALREALPGIQIGIVAPRAFHGLFQAACSPVRLFPYAENWTAARSLVREIRQERWNVAVDLTHDYHLLPAWLARRSGATVVAGFAGSGRDRFFNRVIAASPGAHMQSQFTEAFAFVAPLKPVHQVKLTFKSSHSSPLQRTRNRRVVGFHPGASHPTQRWPAEYFAEVATMTAAMGHHCVMLGLRHEQDLVKRIVRIAQVPIATIINDGDIVQFAADIQQLDLLVCNNSGPLHLAGMLGVPTISVMGPTVKQLWTPLGRRDVVFREDKLPCIGCNLGYCKIQTLACMRDIKPATVFSAIMRSVAPTTSELRQEV